jgi:hypothetical protein
VAQQGTGAAADAGHGAAEQEELERLRAEVKNLRAAQAAGSGGPGSAGSGGSGGKRARGGGRWRTSLAVTLILLGSILAPVAVLGVWAANQVSNTDRYVANMQPLISEPSIQNALTSQITTAITNNVNIQSYTNQVASELQQRNLPRLATLLQNFSGSIASGINSAIRAAVAQVVASPAMAAVWTQANRAAHATMVAVLSGNNNGALKLVNGKVTLQLGPFITKVADQLTARGLNVASLIPKNLNPTFTLFSAPDLEKAQAGYRLVTTLKWVLPLLSLGLLALGIWAARSHRRGLIGAALGLAASMLVLAAALAIARGIYLSSVPQNVLPSDAAAVAYDTLVRFIKEGLRVLLLLGIVIALGAFLTGPSGTAVKIRGGVSSGIAWVRTRGEGAGLNTGGFGVWVGAHKTWLRIGALALVALIFVFSGTPSLALVIWLVVILLLLLALVELFGGGKPAAATAPRPRTGT